MNQKYRGPARHLVPAPSGHFRDYVRKWLIIAGTIGLLTGIATIIIDKIIRVLFLGNAFGGESFTGLTVFLYDSSPVFSFFLPFLGMIAVGLLLRRLSSSPFLSGTDEVLHHYQTTRSPMSVKEGAVKYLASILTIGLGGSAGLEGPSINAGGVAASWFWRRFGSRFSLDREDFRIMLLAGASAGIGAIFKAPLTGIIFALEVPYKDDIARKAFLPSIISGVVSYVVFALVDGSSPLFPFPVSQTSQINLMEIGLSAVLGIIIALISIGWAYLYHRLRGFYEKRKIPLMMRFFIGGVAIGFIALFVRLVYTVPFTYGAGYTLIEDSLLGSFSVELLAALLVLRLLSTGFTLASGGVGGIFFPLVVFGSLTGSLFGLMLHSDVGLFASVGIAAFMSAGYKTPLAAVTFVGDTTGSVSYLIPAMVASFVAYIISGESSVSSEQLLQEEIHVSELLGINAGDAMMLKISPISVESNVSQTIEECLRQRSTQIVVVDSLNVPYVVSLEDALRVEPPKRDTTKAESLPRIAATMFSENDSLENIMDSMFAKKIEIVAIRDLNSSRIIGTLTKNSMLDYIEIRKSISFDSS